MKYMNLTVGQIGMLMTQKCYIKWLLKSNILTEHPKDKKEQRNFKVR